MNVEEHLNRLLGERLRQSNPLWRGHVRVEETGLIAGHAGRRVDILLANPAVPVVAIETSYARNDADRDARSRLGLRYRDTMEEIKTAIAVELEPRHRRLSAITRRTAFRYALHQKAPGRGAYRFPESGFMVGTYNDISRLAASTAIPREDVEEVARGVADRVNAVSGILARGIPEGDLERITAGLSQRSVLPALKTTAILWLNSYLVQHMLVGGVHDIPPASSVPGECRDAWERIREINWESIFAPAVRILEEARRVNPGAVSESLCKIREAVELISAAKLGRNINIGAELFPIVSTDRKESAAFYTRAPVAEFLAAMAITEGMAPDWSDPGLFRGFRICDMACGTGTLLRFGHRQVRIHHERTGRSDASSVERLHKSAMESGLYGVDISPIASHLTSSSLAMGSKQPYNRTNIGWVDVGGGSRTGSIEYLGGSLIADVYGGGGRQVGRPGRGRPQPSRDRRRLDGRVPAQPAVLAHARRPERV